MNAIILCGGLSTRLGDITKDIPKVLLPIKGKTVLEWQLEKIKELGGDTVVLAAGHLSDVLRREAGANLGGVKIIYAVEPEQLGTGGAIKHAWHYVLNPDEPTVIFNGDVLSGIDVIKMRERLRPDSQGIILGAQVDDAAPYGTLEHDEQYRLRAFKEKAGESKPGIINGGVYIFTARAKELFPQYHTFSLEYDIFPFMTDLDVYPSDQPWIDIGVPERLAWAQAKWGNE